ncbi:hypothetical protein NSTCB13_01614 [Nostoc sp. DSM 114160]|jgi:hypothetical protein
MPENSLEVINSSSQNRVIPINRNKEKKPSSKFNKPHCIIPIDDIQWVVNQVKTVQTLWNECWASDQYGSRWMKLTTSLGDKAFRLARQVLCTTGLFEFKRETCTDDTRKTACWLVKNLHGARRIQEFWMKDDDQESAVNNDAISGINEPDISQKIPDVGQKMPDISPETPEKSSLPEPLSNASETSHELLKEVHEDEGHIYVARGNNEALFVPDGCYTVEVVRAQVSQATQIIAPEQNTHWVEKYWVKRSGNKYWYYRYCWMVGRKKNRRHLGSADSITTKQKREIVETAIADGKLPTEIEELIRGWKNESPTMPKMRPNNTNF